MFKIKSLNLIRYYNIFLFLLFLIPSIPYSPITVGRLMPADLILIIIIFLSATLIFLNKFNFKLKFSFNHKLLFIYLLVGISSSIFSPFETTFFKILKKHYLFLTSISLKISRVIKNINKNY